MSGTLDSPFQIGGLTVANRILLAPLAGIGTWFVRLQARRHGAGLAVSEMVSAPAIARGNERTLRMLTVHPEEHPVAIQLFGSDPGEMREAASAAVAAGADIVDINMGCPVPKVRKTGAGASLLADPDRAVAVARACVEGAGGRPVTAKVRSGLEEGDASGAGLAERLVAESGVSAVGFHPRHARVHHQGRPDYRLARELAERIEVPLILSGGLRTPEATRRAHAESGATAVMIARGSFGNPWIFARLAGRRRDEPSPSEVVEEWMWICARASDHFGERRAVPWLRQFHPWYLARLGVPRGAREPFQRIGGLAELRGAARALIEAHAAAA